MILELIEYFISNKYDNIDCYIHEISYINGFEIERLDIFHTGQCKKSKFPFIRILFCKKSTKDYMDVSIAEGPRPHNIGRLLLFSTKLYLYDKQIFNKVDSIIDKYFEIISCQEYQHIN